MIGKKEVAKAIALSIFVKDKIVSSSINDFSYNKLRKITGLSISTLKKRIAILKDMNLVFLHGTHNQNLCFASLCKSHHRNIDISYFRYDNIEELEKCIFASFLIEIQRKKDFVKHTIHIATDGHNLKDIKSAKRCCRKYGYGREYREYGISLRKIAREMGVCIKTAMRVISWAIDQKFINKINRQEQVYRKGIGAIYKYICDDVSFTFCTKDNEYYILANTYSLTESTALSW